MLCDLAVTLSHSYQSNDFATAIGRFLPAYWYVRITNMFGSYANDVFSASTYWMCIGIQLLFFVALFAVYLCVNRRKAVKKPNKMPDHIFTVRADFIFLPMDTLVYDFTVQTIEKQYNRF